MVDWYECSGAHVLAARSTVTYQELCVRAPSPGAVLDADARQILLDVPRTGVSLYRFVLHEHVNEDVNLDLTSLGPHFEALKRILLAYSLRNIRVGYVQGHADVVSFLMGLVANPLTGAYDEEEVFWIYAVVMERIFPSDFFARMPKLQGFHVDMEVFTHLIQTKVPALASVLEHGDLQVLSSLLASKWFMTVWVGEIPLPALSAYWHFMLTGSPDAGSIAHFVMALSLLELASDAIVASVVENDGDASFGYKVALEHAARVDAETISTLLRFNGQKYALTEAAVESMRADIRVNPHFIEQEVCALHGITHFDRTQLEQLQVEFQYIVVSSESKQASAVGINKEHLRQILSRVIPEWSHGSAEQLFQVLQPDARGNVDFQRLMLALSVLCRGTVEEKMRLCFDLYDVDKSGFLGVEKMIAMAASLCEIYQNKVTAASPEAPRGRKKFRSCSSDVTHLVSALHPSGGGGDDDDAALFDRFDRVLPVAFMHKLLRMDVDRDHKLSFKEWYQGALTEPLILRCFQDELVHRRRSSRSGPTACMMRIDASESAPLPTAPSRRRRSNSSDCTNRAPPSPPAPLEKSISTGDALYKRKDGGRISLLSPTTDFEKFSSTINLSSRQMDFAASSRVTATTATPPPSSAAVPPAPKTPAVSTKLLKRSFCEGCVIL
ncbi:Aste57867_14317 [Aphanomyces stellatus]|uniref:Aste57867_14317 protein n=1 Tax=Aphanomyces stellatus TaxID=120398 RepID=A0A485L0B7_9STRA|nr:hypothetical protein As57867_014264 [Aphanomyces stellatus]VFT91141.1 Aste57867_14317 [Aphanomyces stellatus]